MLLQFTVENYRSFRDRAVLSMLADPHVVHAPEQVLHDPTGREILRVAALYGANGSGKSNLVKALSVLRHMIEEGTHGEDPLPIVPFKLDLEHREAPSHFELELVAAGKHYSYGFEATRTRIETEWLYELDLQGEEHLLFERQAGEKAPQITIGDGLSREPRRRAFLSFVAEGTRQNQLFLAEAGERNVTELDPIRQTLKGWTVVAPNSAYLPLLRQLEKNEAFRALMGKILKEAGTGVDSLQVVKEVIEEAPSELMDLLVSAQSSTSATMAIGGELARTLRLDEQGRPEIANLMSIHQLPGGEKIELSIQAESDGTRRLLELAPVLHLMREGNADILFAIDELERSLHPLLTRLLLQLFFAQSKDGTTAQIIFTTHDTNLLDLKILSRDSIWLIEKDARGGSIPYPLSELDQGQVDEVERKGKGLEQGYLQGRFGAIPFFGSLEALGIRKEDLR